MTTPPTPPHRLGEIPLFAGLPAARLDKLAADHRLRTYQAGQELFAQGDPGEYLVVLEEGLIEVSRIFQSGLDVAHAFVEAPAVLGELSLLDGAPRDATVTAAQRSRVRLVPRQTFWDLIRSEPAFVEGLIKTLVRWVRLANARDSDFVGLDLQGRLAKWLLSRADHKKSLSFDLGGRSQDQLARELGATRSPLNKAIQGFVARGIIKYDHPRVTIFKRDELRTYFDF
jgi:CRP-like cAMP-binding protein